MLNDIVDCYIKQEYKLLRPLVGGIGINWRVYGTSFHDTKQSGGLIGNYTYRAADEYAGNVHIKTICNPRAVVGVPNPHFCNYKNGWSQISEKGTIFQGPFFCDASCSKLRINHYESKSREELLAKLKRGWPDQPHTKKTQKFIEERLKVACETWNEVYDPFLYEKVQKWKQAGNTVLPR